MAAIDLLETSATGLETASTAAIAEINALKASEDEGRISAVADRINTVAANLSAAVPTPETPAAPDPNAPAA